MKYQFFRISMHDLQTAQVKLNQFCAQHRIEAVDKQFVNNGENSYWTFCITYADGQENLPKKQKVDYKEILNEDDFSVYLRLRELRKNNAENEGVPAYSIFNNEHLAAMVKQKVTSITELSQIDGIGKSRIEKYGKIFIDFLQKIYASNQITNTTQITTTSDEYEALSD